jgi:hypothetical protein
MLPGFADELEKMARAGLFGRAAGGLGRVIGSVRRGAGAAASATRKGIRGSVVRAKGEFRRGVEIARGISPQKRLQANVKSVQAAKAKAESLARAQARQQSRSKMRNVVLGAGALGAGAGLAGVAAHKAMKKKEPEYQTLY